MVYDADSGRVKRMWGAYGHTPLDMEDRPKPAPPSPDPWVRVSEVLQPFSSPVHDVKVSNDERVYVADRGNKRIQVFTLEGRFIAEQFLGLDNRSPLAGARGVAFSPDPGQKFLNVAGDPVVYILNRRTLEVLGAFATGAPDQADSPGHLIGTDNRGNIYVVQAELTGPDGKSGGTPAFKYVLKGYSPVTRCYQGGGVHSGHADLPPGRGAGPSVRRTGAQIRAEVPGAGFPAPGDRVRPAVSGHLSCVQSTSESGIAHV